MGDVEQIGSFLSSRRGRLRPEDVDLPYFGTRRRVPGLRREELAQIAGISADYYARLEQGRLENVSTEILDAVATALQLSPDERIHLHNLARPPSPADLVEPNSPTLRPALRVLLAALEFVPAYIIGHHTNLLGWNRAAELVFGIDFAELPGERRNWTQLVFLDPRIRALFADEYPALARQVATDLRLRIGHRPGDITLTALITRMRAASTQFDELWTSHDVNDVAFGTYYIEHPELGRIELDYEFFSPIADPGVRALVTYTAKPGSRTEQALRTLIERDRQS
ncbi:helix-turn-helix domain-containing protein [Nocardia flavorosea]|uniref:Helix-turn-helix transcriptional regulator n=1 Tax=Nocardia flavorosea TaxID=53429 RepID=A0A846YDV2_9NOCA|nr:helix-turn-helix transcriptional regulator [Nocardia flavorosea]NKY57047.1 helix-turn-helix transcriptional regulator [Nocardia flavorosea]